ncbi:three-helix bundle dimerization domain-containing protein [Streptomyces griseorubiginosus]|uniref:three-helix bundle dimerization domain-containing protein n=1 Tax=Streptomyces griseorubiginosus TaxID=67304 RepID=UPI0036E82B6C
MTVDEGISRVAVPSLETRDRASTVPPEGGVPPRPPRPGSPRDDDPAARDIVARLAAAWPTVAGTTVEALVASAFESFREAKVRAYVPILVERRVRGVLGALCRDTPSGPGDGRFEGEERE